MTTNYPWVFEECENEGPVLDPLKQPWKHAVRGRKPQRPVVTGYGHTPNAADADARTKASQNDAREVLGERGEVVTAMLRDDAELEAMRKEIREYFSRPHEWKIV